MSVLVEGRRHPDRSFRPDTFADITAADFTLRAGGIEFATASLTAAQVSAIKDRMTSRDDADQAARANISGLRAAVAAPTATTADRDALALAVAAYLLGGA